MQTEEIIYFCSKYSFILNQSFRNNLIITSNLSAFSLSLITDSVAKLEIQPKKLGKYNQFIADEPKNSYKSQKKQRLKNDAIAYEFRYFASFYFFLLLH